MSSSLIAVRRLIFLYFWLLIFEGALRFWVLPGYSSIILLIRDPVVCLIYMLAIPAGLIPKNAAISLTVMLAAVSGVASLTVGDAPWLITAYGLRTNYLHLPLIFVMQRVLSSSDVLRLGRWMMWLMIPMAVLVVQQFRSPPGSLINFGGYTTHYGTVRPAGTFSFVSGMVGFTALVAAFLANAFVSAGGRNLLLKILCSLAVLTSLAVSGSRSSVLAVGIIFVMLAGLSLVSSSAARGFLALAGVIGLGTAGMSSTEFFEEGQRQLEQRFKDAAQGQGVIESSWQRFVDMFNYPIGAAQEAPAFGHGLGTGTNVGYFLVTGKRGFGGGHETELGRIFYEMGPLFGLIFILLRVGLSVLMVKAGWLVLARGNLLPLLLFGAVGMNMLFGQWGVATTLGFACFGTGLCLASVKIGLAKRPMKKHERAEPSTSQLREVGGSVAAL
jgi:O-antigen ligase